MVINEVLAHTDAPVELTDSIELHNTTTAPINVGGWFLSDSTSNLFAFEIPAGTTIPAGGFVVFTEAQFNAPNDDEGFGLSSLGDDVYLVRGTKATGTVTQFVDDVHFGATLNGESLGRIPNGDGPSGAADPQHAGHGQRRSARGTAGDQRDPVQPAAHTGSSGRFPDDRGERSGIY